MSKHRRYSWSDSEKAVIVAHFNVCGDRSDEVYIVETIRRLADEWRKNNLIKWHLCPYHPRTVTSVKSQISMMRRTGELPR